MTIPGWQVSQGLPTVVSYGTKRFPGASGAQPTGHPARLFAGGAGGTAVLTQQVPLRTAAGHGVPPGTRYHVSAWLGGTVVSKASLEVIFLSAAGKALGERRIGPVGGAGDASHPEFAWRQGSGTLPRGTRSARAVLDLATSLTNYNGPYAPQVGYDRATAGGLRFSVSAPVRGLALAPPAARVPRYQHVFMFYFENEDFRQIVGNTRQAPYLNSLLRRASLLGQFYAEEHPSDGNYLALAGGSTFGVPLDDPAEENPQYTIDARNISDLIDGAHESWKGYLQSAAGPCDDTVHGYYWDDDLPMMYFADVRDRPGLLRVAHGPAGVAGRRPAKSVDHAELRLGQPGRLLRHGGLRHQGRRRLPRGRARPDHALARVDAGSGRSRSSRSTRTPTTTSTRPSGSRRSCSDRRTCGRATSRRSATPTTACCARSRARSGSAP